MLYRTRSGLSKAPVGGGPSQEIWSSPDAVGLDWADDGMILYSDETSIRRIPDTGGAPSVLVTAPTGGSVVEPQLLPGGRALLYTIYDDTGFAVVAQRLNGAASEARKLLPGTTKALYVMSGHLVYGLEGRLMAVPFDADPLELTGPAVPIPEPVQVTTGGFPQVAVSNTGALAYVTREEAPALQLSWVEPQGQARPVVTVPRNYSDLVLSPDGRLAALHVMDQDNDIWKGRGKWSSSVRPTLGSLP